MQYGQEGPGLNKNTSPTSISKRETKGVETCEVSFQGIPDHNPNFRSESLSSNALNNVFLAIRLFLLNISFHIADVVLDCITISTYYSEEKNYPEYFPIAIVFLLLGVVIATLELIVADRLKPISAFVLCLFQLNRPYQAFRIWSHRRFKDGEEEERKSMGFSVAVDTVFEALPQALLSVSFLLEPEPYNSASAMSARKDAELHCKGHIHETYDSQSKCRPDRIPSKREENTNTLVALSLIFSVFSMAHSIIQFDRRLCKKQVDPVTGDVTHVSAFTKAIVYILRAAECANRIMGMCILLAICKRYGHIYVPVLLVILDFSIIASLVKKRYRFGEKGGHDGNIGHIHWVQKFVDRTRSNELKSTWNNSYGYQPTMKERAIGWFLNVVCVVFLFLTKRSVHIYELLTKDVVGPSGKPVADFRYYYIYKTVSSIVWLLVVILFFGYADPGFRTHDDTKDLFRHLVYHDGMYIMYIYFCSFIFIPAAFLAYSTASGDHDMSQTSQISMGDIAPIIEDIIHENEKVGNDNTCNSDTLQQAPKKHTQARCLNNFEFKECDIFTNDARQASNTNLSEFSPGTNKFFIDKGGEYYCNDDSEWL